MDDFTTRDQVERVYQKLAPRYDWAARWIDRFGFGYDRLRRLAVERLALQPGDTVVEIGCGTGVNFPLLQDRIGPEGRIIGVDLTQAMLDEARRRTDAAGWRNVELVQSAAGGYRFPEGGVDGVLTTFALTLEPDYDAVVAAISGALKPGRRFAIADLKLARGWTLMFLPFLLLVARPFAVSLKLARRHPWESMQRHMAGFEMTERFGGYLYVASATADPRPAG